MKKGGKLFNLNISSPIEGVDKYFSSKMSCKNISESLKCKSPLEYKGLLCAISPNNKSKAVSSKEYFYNKKIQLYKTEICRSHSETGYCKYESKCQFAHDVNELRIVNRHPRYKTETCRTFWEEGSCPYGKRCCFIHIKNKSLEKERSSLESSLFVAENVNTIIKDINCTSNFLKLPTKSFLQLNYEELDTKSVDNQINISTDQRKKSSKKNCDDLNENNPSIFQNEDLFDDMMFSSIDQLNYKNTSEIKKQSSDLNTKNKITLDFKNLVFEDYEFDRERQIDEKLYLSDVSPKEDVIFDTLIFSQRKSFWENNENLLWTLSPLFYANNNHIWNRK